MITFLKGPHILRQTLNKRKKKESQSLDFCLGLVNIWNSFLKVLSAQGLDHLFFFQ